MDNGGSKSEELKCCITPFNHKSSDNQVRVSISALCVVPNMFRTHTGMHTVNAFLALANSSSSIIPELKGFGC